MGLFKKKKQPVVEEHVHKWRDFNWYMKASYSDGRCSIEIYEPYVCVSCKTRKDILLYRHDSRCSKAEFYDKVREYEKEFADNLRPKAVIEDQVNDMILVDKDFIEAWDKLHKQKLEDFEKQSASVPKLVVEDEEVV